MNLTTRNTLMSIILGGKNKTVLELGSGIQSTSSISQWLKLNGGGTLTSLEEDKTWYDKVNEKIGESTNVSLIKCDVEVTELGIQYSHKFLNSEKFDLIFIDGPGHGESYFPYVLNNMDKYGIFAESYMESSSPWMQTTGPKAGRLQSKVDGGIMSIDILEYVLPLCHDETKIVLDGRVNALIYYVYKYGDLLNFYFLLSDRSANMQWCQNRINLFRKRLTDEAYNKVFDKVGNKLFFSHSVIMKQK